MSADQPVRPASRRRTRPERGLRSPLSALAAAAVVAVSAGAVAVAATVTSPSPDSNGSRGELVNSAVLACPDLPRTRNTRLQVGSAEVPGVSHLAGNGEILRGPVGGVQTPLELARGALLTLPKLRGREAVVTASGAAAAGLFGYRTDAVAADDTLAVSRCTEPRASWWFTGAGATLDHSSSLVMQNVDPGPAVVDVRVLGDDAEVETVGTSGITIASGESVVVDLAEVAPLGEQLAVSVRASRGRVVAAVSDSLRAGAGNERGVEWLAAQTTPSRVLRVAGVSAGSGARTLLVGNPSDLEALVEVQVAGRSGTFTPSEAAEVRVAPGAVASLEVAEALGDGPVTVRLRSNLPIVATVRSITGSDSSYAGVVLPLHDVAAAPVPAGGDARVVLTAGERGARAELTAYTSRGERIDRVQLDLEPSTSRSWKPERGADYLVVDPARGAVFGAVTLTGPGTSQAPLVSLPVRLRRPSVQPALR